MTTDLVQSVSIENLMSHRAALEEKLHTAYEALHEAEKILDSLKDNVVKGFVPIRVKDLFDRHSTKRVDFMDDAGVKDALSRVDANLWDALFNESGIRTFMDAKARTEWHENLSTGNFPPMTPENVRSTFAGLYDQRGDFFERGVVNLFRKRSWDYKSNSPVCFGRRLILEYLHTNYGGGQWLSLNHDKCNEIDDLTRVFSVMDGKEEPDHRQGVYKLLRAAKSEDANGELSTDYFRIKWFRNGNGHLYFTRKDLVDELNRIVKKHHPEALPPAKKDAWNPKAEAEARKHAHRNGKADFFATPLDVAYKLIEGLEFDREKSWVLEPSAGEGGLAKVIRHRFSGDMDLIEKDPTRAAKLEQLGFENVRVADFLEVEPQTLYTHVIMNSPFSGGQDIDHVLHAYEFLAPGGDLRAIVGAGALELRQPRCLRFQSWLKQVGAEVEELPAGAFKESGTMVRAVIARLKKPQALESAA